MSAPTESGYIKLNAPITDIETIPASITKSGTLTADATIQTKIYSDGGATPTCDFSVVKVGDYIYNAGEIRKVVANHTGNDNNARIDIASAFTVRPVAQNFVYVPNKLYKKLIILNSGSGALLINGVAYPVSTIPITLEADQGLEAIVLDAGTNFTTANVIEAW